MAFTDAYTNETATSATFNPTDSVSEYIIEGTFTGTVRLQMSVPDINSWKDITVVVSSSSANKAEALFTPDPAVDYRFVATAIVGTVNVHFGP